MLPLDALLLLGSTAALTVGGGVGLASLLVRRPAPPPSEAAVRARQHATVVNVTACLLALAWAVGPVAAYLGVVREAIRDSDYGTIRAWWWPLVYSAGPLVVGLSYLGVHAVGEWRWPRPTGTRRRAALVPRDDSGPVWLRRLTLTWACLIAAVLVGLFSVRNPNLPSQFWTLLHIGVVVSTVALVAATAGVLALIRARPAVVDTDPDYDAASRRLSAHRVLRGTQFVLAMSLALNLIMVFYLFTAGWTLPSGVGNSAAVLGFTVAVTGVVVSAVPARAAKTTEVQPSVPEAS